MRDDEDGTAESDCDRCDRAVAVDFKLPFPVSTSPAFVNLEEDPLGTEARSP